MNENNNNDNQNNTYNIYNAMNVDAFNVFNQNTNNAAPENTPQQPAQPAPTAPVQPVQPKPVQDPNLVTVNDYKEPKKPFSFKDLLKKKIEEEEKTYSIDDITNFKDDKKEVDMEEVKEKRKKIKDIIILVVAVIALVIVGIVAYNVFTNYLLPNQNIIDSNTINKNIRSSKVAEKKGEVVKYNCNYNLDNAFYDLPAGEYIDWESYNAHTTYIFLDDRLDVIEEKIDIKYSDIMMDDVKGTVISYCNAYNKVLDQYLFLCHFSNNHLIIDNAFYLNKMVGEPTNRLGTYKLNYHKNSILGDIIINNNSCTLVQ